MGIEGNYSLRESGLWVPKYENNPPKTYQNWSETYANQSSQQATVQTVTYKQLPNGKYEATLPNGQTKILNDTKVLENYAKKHGFTLQNATNLQPLAQDTVQITNNKAGLQPVRTYTKHAQEHGTTYHKPPKSGVVKADEIAAQRIAENAQKQTVQHTRQRYAAGVTDTYIGGTLEDLRNVEPLGNRAPELSQPVPKPAPQPTPKSTIKIPQGTTVTPHPHIPNGYTPNTTTGNIGWTTTTTATVPYSVSTKIEGHNITGQPRTLTESAKETAQKAGEVIREKAGQVAEKAEQVAEKAKEQVGKLGESAEGWWKSLKTSVEKNPTKWGLGAAAVALGLWVLSSSDKKQNV